MIIEAAATREQSEAIGQFYAEVFTAPPWNQVHNDSFAKTAADYRERLLRDSERTGFRAVTIHRDDRIVAYGCGWVTTQWREDRAYPKVVEYLGRQRVDDTLVGSFEVDELAVAADQRGNGLGRAVLGELLHDIPRAWLLTWTGTPETVAFYRHLGWCQLEPLPSNDTNLVVFMSS